MTVLEAISLADHSYHNSCGQEEKVRWLSRLDGRIHREILSLYDGCGAFREFDPRVDLNRQLLVKEPYDELYIRHLQAQIAYQNGEIEDYNNANTLFQNLLEGFQKDCHRRLGRKTQKQRFRF